MVGNLNTSDETNYLLVAMFQFNLSFQAGSFFQNDIFFKMGSQTEILSKSSPFPIPNPAHNSRERMMKVSHSRTTNWRFSSWWGILVLFKIKTWWLSHLEYDILWGVESVQSNRELKISITPSLPPFNFCLP